MPKPLCFMVMPYGRKPTQAEPGRGPADIDFNALWDRAYAPVIAALGYEAVRADQDTGALIVAQMLERLYFADLVLADMTIPNGNVYYEIGIRHAARPTGCVLLAADWSRPLFDVAQMRTVRYPLSDGQVDETAAAAIRAAIGKPIAERARGMSPMHQSIGGYPTDVDARTASTMKDRMAEQAAFQGEIRAVRAVPAVERTAQARRLVERHGSPPLLPAVALALVKLLRDCASGVDDWNALLAFIDGLPDDLASASEMREQRALALSRALRHVDAIAGLEALIALDGPTPERLGLLGGRYKRLMAAATGSERQRLLAQAIDCYERGMEMDLNEYYCAANLPALYRARARKGDEERVQTVLRLTIAACNRAKKRGTTDPWLRATLLGAAFGAGDADTAEALGDEVAAAGFLRWQYDSIRDDLTRSLQQVGDPVTRERLEAVVRAIAP